MKLKKPSSPLESWAFVFVAQASARGVWSLHGQTPQAEACATCLAGKSCDGVRERIKGPLRSCLLLRFAHGTRTQTVSDLRKRAREQYARVARARPNC